MWKKLKRWWKNGVYGRELLRLEKGLKQRQEAFIKLGMAAEYQELLSEINEQKNQLGVE